MTAVGEIPAYIYAILYVIGLALGFRGSVRTTRRFVDSAPRLTWPERVIVLLFAAVSWLIVLAGGFWGFLAIRSIAGFEPIGLAAAFASAFLATLILYVPTIIDLSLEWVARQRGGDTE